MGLLNECIREYTNQLGKGQIQKAYRGIITFMSDLKASLERRYPDFSLSAVYPGYMDMTYFAFTPSVLKDRKLKIAVVYLHEESRIELWLAGNNRQTQAEYIELLRHKDIGNLALSEAGPGVDAIIALCVAEHPDFEDAETLKAHIEKKTTEFARRIESILA